MLVHYNCENISQRSQIQRPKSRVSKRMLPILNALSMKVTPSEFGMAESIEKPILSPPGSTIGFCYAGYTQCLLFDIVFLLCHNYSFFIHSFICQQYTKANGEWKWINKRNSYFRLSPLLRMLRWFGSSSLKTLLTLISSSSVFLRSSEIHLPDLYVYNAVRAECYSFNTEPRNDDETPTNIYCHRTSVKPRLLSSADFGYIHRHILSVHVLCRPCYCVQQLAAMLDYVVSNTVDTPSSFPLPC